MSTSSRLALALVVGFALSLCACAPLAVQAAPTVSLRAVDGVAYVGVVDGRSDVDRAAVDVSVDAIARGVHDGYLVDVKDAPTVVDLSARAEKGAGAELALPTFAAQHKDVRGPFASVELTALRLDLDDATTNHQLGVAAMVVGALAPCTLCITAPALLYPVVAVTRARADARAVLRLYDPAHGAMVLRVPVDASVVVEAGGFHDPADVAHVLVPAVLERVGNAAAARTLAFFRDGGADGANDGGVDGDGVDDNAQNPVPAGRDDDPLPAPPPLRTPSLDRPAGQR
jgi:hypothetical protein